MKLYKKIIAGTLIVGTLVSCRGKNKSNKPSVETIIGEPMSVQVAGGTHSSRSLSTVIKTEDEKYVLCNAGPYHISRLTDAAALIESEMRDGDSEPVKITGYWDGNRFKMSSVSANGHEYNLSN